MNTINLDSYDKAAFNWVKKESPGLQKLEESGASKNVAFPHLMEDVYGSLYKYDPLIKEEIEPGFTPNKKIMEQLMQMREYNELREFTCLQEFESAVGVQSFSEQLIQNLPEEVKQRMDDLAKAQEAYNNLLESENPSPKQIIGTKQTLQEYAKATEEIMSSTEFELHKIIREAIQKGAEEAKEMSQFLNAFGTEPGQPCTLPMEEKVKMAQKIKDNPTLKKIAQIAGRFQRLALHYQSTKTKHGVDEIVDITTGNDLNRIVPTELVLMDDPDLDILFYQKYSERKLLQFEMQGKETKGKGPIIICIDNSGSMAGEREAWAKGFALGLLTIARKQKRNFAIIHFGNATELKTFTFDKKVNSEELLVALSHFFGGGTNFERPLREAISLLYKENSILKEADIVFVSDGECSLGPESLKFYTINKQKLQFKTYGVLIQTSTETLPFPTDATFKLDTLQNDDVILKTVFGKI